jgi:hypothetical protein
MKNTLFLITILLFLNNELFSQPKMLTKAQMYEDFDEFVTIIQDCNPQLSLRKIVTGVDQMEKIKSLRSGIDTTTSILSFFINIMGPARNYLLDERNNNPISTDGVNLSGIDTNMIRWQRSLLNKYWRQRIMQENHDDPWCNPMYINGDYYILPHVMLVSKDRKDTIFLRTAQLLSYNNIPFHTYAQDNHFSTMRWDESRKQYYALNTSFPSNKNVISIINEGNKIDIDQNVYTNKIFQESHYDYPELPEFGSIKTTCGYYYFEKEKTLYIWFKEMNDDKGVLAKQIKQLEKINPIEKIIIDVRRCTGKNDIAWERILKSIVANTLPNKVTLAIKNTQRIRDYYSNAYFFSDINKLPVQKLEYLNNEEFIIADMGKKSFVPDVNSLKYKGKIFIIQDEETYSSAQALSAYARQIEQLVSIGVPVGLLGGRSIAPAMFQLKNSKYTFELETVLDITNTQTPIEVYHDQPEILIEIPLNEQFKEKIIKYRYDPHSREYLIKHDYLFKKVLEMK